MTHLIGIDFGTTKTLVACFNHETKQAELIRLGRGIDKIPTAVYYDQDGRFLFGEDADDQMVWDAVRYKRGFKLELGSNVPSLLIDRNTKFRAVDLTCEFFKYIKGRCEEEVFNGEKVTKVFITMPVSFSPAQQKELKQAALNAGFLNVTLLTEPEAAGRAFFHINPANDLKSVMVVDWGGGTVDIAVVSRDGDAISVDANSSWGNDKLGGEAFDELLWVHVTDKIMKTDSRNRNPADEPLEIINTMFKQVRSCKERLSKKSAAKIIFSGSMGPYVENVTQAEFEDLIRHSVEDIGNKVKELLQKIRQRGGIYPEALLLIGGSSSIPLIRQVLAEKSGLKCLSWQYAHEAVAMGAALAAEKVSSDTYKILSYEEVVRDPSKIHLIQRLAEDGNAEAQYQLGVHYASGGVIAKDIFKATWWIQKAAKHKHPAAQYMLGCHYSEGLGVTANQYKAVEWFQKSAKEEHMEAQYMLGCHYSEGLGVAADQVKAVEWFRKAAEKGHMKAQYLLGCHYSEGLGITPDLFAAVKWFRKAAEQGFVEAQYVLAHCFGEGKGIVSDHGETVKWFRKAAEQGHTEAQFQLGECYFYGRGVSANRTEGVKWFRKAAEQGHAEGQYKLGRCYFYGRGVLANRPEAEKWFLKAAEQGCTKAVGYLAHRTPATPPQITEHQAPRSIDLYSGSWCDSLTKPDPNKEKNWQEILIDAMWDHISDSFY